MNAATLVVTPSSVTNAYRQADRSSGAAQASDASASFGATLERAMQGAIGLGHAADGAATDAVVHGGDITHVVTAVSKAQLALQEVVAVRDKVVQAYQEIMRMQI